MGHFHPRRVRAFSAVTAALLAGGLAAMTIPSAATAAPTTTGTTTSVAYTAGKGVGSGQWGVVGDIRTLESGTTYTYGADINPVTGSLTVSDSGKVVYSALCSFIGMSNPCQTGTPSIADYALLGGDPAAIGTTDVGATEYLGAGAYAVNGAASSSRTRNTGIGQLYETFADRTNVALPVNAQNGPRGIAHTADGVAWVVNSEAVAPVGGAPGAVDRYDVNLTPLTGAGWTGAWAQREEPGVHFYRTGIDTTPDGSILVNSEVSDRFQRYDGTGASTGSVLLDLAGPVYRNPYSVAVDKIDGSMYVPLINFRDTPAVTPFLEKRNAANEVVGQFTSSALLAGQVVFSAEVEPRTQDVFAWSQNGSIVQWDKDGAEVQVFRNGTTPGTFPGLTTPRGMTFDDNGRMYITVAEGTSSTRVMILGKTPDPVTSVCSQLGADRTTASLTIDCASGPAGAEAPYQQTQLLDYMIEASTDGGTTWQVLTKDAGVSAEREQTVSGLDPAANYTFRVSAWNEAGNGDWITSTPIDYTTADVTFDGVENTAVIFDALTGDAGSSVPTGIALVDADGATQPTLTVDGEGTYTVNADDTITFTPVEGFTGDVTPVTIAVLFDGCDLRKTITGTLIAKPRLTLQATVVGGTLTADDIDLTAIGPSTITGVTGATAVTHAVVDGGEYTLAADDLASYTASDWTCVLTGTETAVDVSVSAVIGLVLSQDVTCSIVYTFVPTTTPEPSTPPVDPTGTTPSSTPTTAPTTAGGLAATGQGTPVVLIALAVTLLIAGGAVAAMRRSRRG
ncbi:hypothetical protein ACI3KS_18795 [Microbacterium sp. ZW T5_45]|uniref:hypothetical protein n=1 Tax=Microbacterium sp. ZW T5_45 TaxID=3378080 RepID=UPI0038531F8A